MSAARPPGPPPRRADSAPLTVSGPLATPTELVAQPPMESSELAPTPASGPFLASISSDKSKLCPKCLGRYPADFNVCPKDATPLQQAPEDGDPLLGNVLGSTYQITRVLGEGGMGRVYEAKHLRLASRRFAVKVLHAEYARHNDVLSRFQREAEAAASITHTHVLEVFDVARTEDGRPYIVGEFLEGQDFHEFLEKVGRVDVKTAVAITRQLCGALQAAHDAGVVHRDLKPENVYVVQDRVLFGGRNAPFVKILDFGISKIEGRETNLTRTGMIMGTPNYMAPEQARGEKVDHRADIYALGAILYRMLTGKRAFDGTDAGAVMTAVLNDEPRRPRAVEPSLPESIEIVIQKAMAKDRAERYQNMRELDQELAAFDVLGTLPSPTITVQPAGNDGLRTDEHARTFLGDNSAVPSAVVERRAAERQQLELKGREAKLARPTIVLLTPVALAWILTIVVAAAAGVIRAMGKDGHEISDTELGLMLLFSVVAGITPLVVWIVHLVKHIWSNSVRAVQLAADMRRFLAGSLVAYGLASVIVRLAYTVLMRDSRVVLNGWWDLLFLLFAFFGGAFGAGIGPLVRLRRRLLNA